MNIEIYRQITKRREQINKNLSIHTEGIEKLKKHYWTKGIDKSKKAYRDPIRFIKQSYPDVFKQVANVNIYSTTASAIKSCLRLEDAYGFFSTRTSDIFLTFGQFEYDELIKINPTIDEILCHEMLHAVSFFRGSGGFVRYANIEEDFAYGGMIPYIRSKGYNDKEIANRTLLAYCLSKHLQNKDYFKELGYDRKKMSHSDFCSAWARIRRVYKNGLRKGAFEEAMEFIKNFGNKRAIRFEGRFSALEF